MRFNLNEFLIALSFALDFVEMDIFGIVTNHSKRVAYMSMRMAEKLGMSQREIFDIVSLSILHDNGASEKILHDKLKSEPMSSLQSIESKQEHGLKGEENVRDYPFLTDVRNVIKYHHENYDGTGFFQIKGDDIPVMAQIIKLADTVELNTSLNKVTIAEKRRIQDYVKSQEMSTFSPKIVNAFIDVSQTPHFWLDLKDEFIHASLQRNIPNFSVEMTFAQLHNITRVFSKIIDAKSTFTQVHSSELADKVAKMGEYYKKPDDEIYKLIIAADLHDIGKLAVSNAILDKPGRLDEEEFDAIKQHSYYTRLSLQEIQGFEDIMEWASNHHEKLNGKGYPYGKKGTELDFNSRLIACLDVYQALTENRPYRKAMTHRESSEILMGMIRDGSLDEQITSDVIGVFKK
ncbi:HD domain-containing protein [Heliobacillus mobilis]|uniref:HD domain-containing protein n=1 Tax=Heliobacterium mobile TaxID=28064 RepID=A0A6I3SHV1_HELMO|nr:HD domain-containing phosphohydrolase [Heliobacterium mobile]MTV48287.1 HD domain-containing protein [Heliobacterium mobile]